MHCQITDGIFSINFRVAAMKNKYRLSNLKRGVFPDMKIVMFILLMLMPCTVFAECRLTELDGKIEGVCWGYNPVDGPVPSTKNIQNMKKKDRVYRSSKVDVTGDFMTDEELRFMQARNRMDGYRGKVQVAKK
jgi:hypothetical protein